MSHLNTPKDNFQPSVSVVMYSYNAEKDIADCIESALLLTSDIILIDLESTDRTKEIAQKKVNKIIEHPHVNYVELVRNLGMQEAKTDWVFILEDDERITSELAAEIKEVIVSQECTHYKVPRKEFFARKVWLQHGGLWPNYQPRLIHKQSFKDWPPNIHSTPIIEGKERLLHNPLLHYSKNDYEEIVKKTINFEDIESDLLYKADKPVSTLTFFRKFLAELYRRLFKWQGYKDGTIGIIESIYQAFSKTITYLYLYEKKKSRSL